MEVCSLPTSTWLTQQHLGFVTILFCVPYAKEVGQEYAYIAAALYNLLLTLTLWNKVL